MVASSDAAATRQQRPTHASRHSTAATVRTAQGRPDSDGTPHNALAESALPRRAGPEMGDEPGHAPEP